MMFRREVASAILREALVTNRPFGKVDGIDHEDFIFHAALLSDLGFIKVELDIVERCCQVNRITWDGYSKLSDFDEALGKEFDPRQYARRFPRS